MFRSSAAAVSGSVAALASLLLQGAAAADVPLSPPQILMQGADPWVPLARDLDADGDVDLVVVCRFANAVTVLLNDGSGAMTPLPAVAVPGQPAAIAAADIDGDGDLDLAVAQFSVGSVMILRNDGGGALITAQSLAAGQAPASVAFADLSQDGAPDVAVANALSNNAAYYTNSGAGAFGPGVSVPAGVQPHSLVLGDFDADADTDLAIASFLSGNVQVFRNIDGAFSLAQTVSFESFGAFSLQAVDFDRDGDLDLTAREGHQPGIGVAVNDGVGGFGDPVSVGLQQPMPYGEALLADLNGDGYPDLVRLDGTGSSGEITNSISIAVHNGTGGFGEFAATPAGTAARFADTADFDGDGRVDLVVANTGRNGATPIGPSSLMIFRSGCGPTISAHPIPVSACLGQAVELEIAAQGDGPVQYQWRRDGLDLPGADQPTLAIAALSPGDAGVYEVVLRDACGFVRSHPARLEVQFPVDITAPPEDVRVPPGGTIVLSVEASGSPPLSYQWFRGVEALADDGRVLGSQTLSLTMSLAEPADAGEYLVVVSNGCGAVPSSSAHVEVRCRADWNGDGPVNSGDISAFLTSWLASVLGGTLEADFSENGVVNSADISAFLVAWLDAVDGGCGR